MKQIMSLKNLWYFERFIIWIPDYAKMLPENMTRMIALKVSTILK